MPRLTYLLLAVLYLSLVPADFSTPFIAFWAADETVVGRGACDPDGCAAATDGRGACDPNG